MSTLPTRIPHDEIEAELFRAYILAHVAQWPRYQCSLAQEHEAGVWRLFISPRQDEAPFDLSRILEIPTADGLIWLVEDAGRPRVAWTIGEQHGLDSVPVLFVEAGERA